MHIKSLNTCAKEGGHIFVLVVKKLVSNTTGTMTLDSGNPVFAHTIQLLVYHKTGRKTLYKAN